MNAIRFLFSPYFLLSHDTILFKHFILLNKRVGSDAPSTADVKVVKIHSVEKTVSGLGLPLNPWILPVFILPVWTPLVTICDSFVKLVAVLYSRIYSNWCGGRSN